MKGIFFIFLACVLWAIDTLIRYPLLGQGVSANRIVFTEHLLLTLFFLPFLWANRKRWWKAQFSHVVYFLVVGGLGSALATLAFTKAFGLINPSLVILLQKLQPLVAIGLARLILREPIHSKFMGWAAVCLLGGILVSVEDIIQAWRVISWDHAVNSKILLGHGLALLAVVSWGSATVFGKKLELEGYSGREIMAGRFSMGFMCLIPVWYLAPFPLIEGPMVLPKIALMALLSGLLGMYAFYQGLQVLPARLCTLAEMFFPFCAVAVNWIFLGTTLGPVQMAGGFLLLLGSTVIQWKRY